MSGSPSIFGGGFSSVGVAVFWLTASRLPAKSADQSDEAADHQGRCSADYGTDNCAQPERASADVPLDGETRPHA
jgi:hypothetical protein